MNKQVLYTFLQRIGISVFNFVLVVITAQLMGATIRGDISLVMLAITFTQIVHQFFGGNPLIYFSRKTAPFNLLMPSYIWSIFSAGAVVFILNYFNQLPANTVWWVITLSLLQALISTHTTMLLAAELIVKQNVVMLIQSFTTLLFILIQYGFTKHLQLMHYIFALLAAYLIAAIISTFFLIKHKWSFENQYQLNVKLIYKIFSYGIIMQSTNICQFLNYRLSFYLLHAHSGKAALGVFSTAIALGESSWLLSKSLTNVQYPKIVHQQNTAFRLLLTNDFAKKAFVGTLVLLLPLLFFPQPGYTLVFGQDFTGLKPIVLGLSLGLLLMGFTAPVSHFFSGVLQNRVNLFASVLGILVTGSLGWLLISNFGVAGATVTTLISYTLTALFLIGYYCHQNKISIKDVIPHLSDIKQYLNSKKKLT
jgi:O-antigen/teichoic acid export membrane protein